MTRDQVVQQVNLILHGQLELAMERLVPQATLFDDLGLDSLDAVDMLVYLEEKLKVKVNVEAFKHARTVGDIHDLISELVMRKG